jgi:hypothetical protein
MSTHVAAGLHCQNQILSAAERVDKERHYEGRQLPRPVDEL